MWAKKRSETPKQEQISMPRIKVGAALEIFCICFIQDLRVSVSKYTLCLWILVYMSLEYVIH